MQIANAAIERIEQRLQYAFMLHTAIQRPGERVTAEEIRSARVEPARSVLNPDPGAAAAIGPATDAHPAASAQAACVPERAGWQGPGQPQACYWARSYWPRR